MVDPKCPICLHRAHTHSGEGSRTPGCRVIGCGCTYSMRAVVQYTEEQKNKREGRDQ